MTFSNKIITLARRYCLELFQHESSTQRSIGDGLLRGVEFAVGATFQSIDDCKNQVKLLGLQNLKIRTSGFYKKYHLELISFETQKFIEFIDQINLENIGDTEPLPFRRRMVDKEIKIIRDNLKYLWGFNSGYWEPLTKCSLKPYFYCEIEQLDNSDFEEIKEILAFQGDKRIFEINEDHIDYEIDCFEFDKDGCEVIYTDNNHQWLIYISHEGTIAFGGENFMAIIKEAFNYKIEFKN